MVGIESRNGEARRFLPLIAHEARHGHGDAGAAGAGNEGGALERKPMASAEPRRHVLQAPHREAHAVGEIEQDAKADQCCRQ